MASSLRAKLIHRRYVIINVIVAVITIIPVVMIVEPGPLERASHML